VEPAPGLDAPALTALLGLATKARDWSLVRALTVQLEDAEQRQAALSPKVTSLDAARRRKREEGGK
jgi:hypothetical protein